MTDFMDTLATDAKATVDSGYYEQSARLAPTQASLKHNILQCEKNPVIAEIKAASPSKGTIRSNCDAAKIARAMSNGGAAGISVLTEPKHFNGSLKNLLQVREAVNLPVLMKDIVVDPAQIAAAAKFGANAVLLIQAIFDRHHCPIGLDAMIAKAHSKNLEILLETHTVDEFARAMETQADLIGINNRNLSTLQIDLNTTKKILSKCSNNGKMIVSESGVNAAADVRFLRGCGARAFLIGSAIMTTNDVETKVKEYVNA